MLLDSTLIESQRLILKPVQRQDTEFIYNYINNKRVNRYMRDAETITVTQVNTWINSLTETESHLIIYDKSNFRPLGLISARITADPSIYECGIGVLPEYWGIGIGTEAMVSFCMMLSGIPHIEMLVAEIAKTNIASQRVFQKVGFELIGESKYSKNDDSMTYESYIFRKYLK